MRTKVCLLTLVAILPLVMPAAVAQQKTARTAPKPGVVSGRVFAIRQGGDIKPARMAKVYLLWKYHSLNEALAEEKKGMTYGSADLTFSDRKIKAMQANLDESQRDAAAQNYWSDSLRCSKDLGAVDDAILATWQWCIDQKKMNQIPMADADEEGNFRITGVRPGVYDVIARGRAGFNDAFWDIGGLDSGLQHITVAAGTEITLKLSSPEKSCLDEN
jgi:hypothetical protein